MRTAASLWVPALNEISYMKVKAGGPAFITHLHLLPIFPGLKLARQNFKGCDVPIV
jgi:hypothetical protein